MPARMVGRFTAVFIILGVVAGAAVGWRHAHPQPPTPSYTCPTVSRDDPTTSSLDTVISETARRTLKIEGTLNVHVTGVWPEDPDWTSADLTTMRWVLAGCFVNNVAELDK